MLAPHLSALAARLLGNQFCTNFNISTVATVSSRYASYRVFSYESCLQIQASSIGAAKYGFGRFIREHVVLLTPNNMEGIEFPVEVREGTRMDEVLIENNGYDDELVRYYQNVCTEGYSFAFWDWPRWEREIDWMALNGISTTLLSVGQESHFLEAFTNLGIPETEVSRHFFAAGPFSPWQRMGNMKRYGGGQTNEFMKNRLALSKKIFKRLIELEIRPILPAFAGFVPDQILDAVPNTLVYKEPVWGELNSTFSGVMYLNVSHSATYDLFQKIQADIFDAQTKTYGHRPQDVDFYADTFNEMSPKSDANLTAFSRVIYDGIARFSTSSKWVLQGWLFLETWFWSEERKKAYIASIPQEKLLILDLNSEARPIYNKGDGYIGKNFVWNMLNNFGGNYGMVGHVQEMLKIPEILAQYREHANGRVVGLGYTPEGTGRNYFLVDMLATIWGDPDISGGTGFDEAWLKRYIDGYTRARFGASIGVDMYAILARSVYNDTLSGYPDKAQIRSGLVDKPTLHFHHSPDWYTAADIGAAWDACITADFATKPVKNYFWEFDKVELSRQALSLIFSRLHARFVYAVHFHDVRTGNLVAQEMAELFQDLETLLCSFPFKPNPFSSETWLQRAKNLNQSWQARDIITLWGPFDYVGRSIVDYAAKMECGLISEYYMPRWMIFFIQVSEGRFDRRAYVKTVFEQIEYPYVFNNSSSFTAKKPRRQKTDIYKLYNKWRTYLY